MNRTVALPYDPTVVDRVIDERRQLDGALMPVLHDVQEALGWVPAQAVPRIAEALNLSRAEVHGVVTYYHHFRAEPARRATCCRCAAPRPARHGPTRCGARAAAPRLPLHGRRPPAAARSSRCTAWACARMSPALMLDGDAACAHDAGQRFDALHAPKPTEAGMSDHASTCRAMPPRWPSAPTPWRAPIAAQAAQRGIEVQAGAQRLARPVVAGAAGRGATRRRAASPTARCTPRTCRPCSTPASAGRARTRCASARPKRSPTCKRQQRLTFARIGHRRPAVAGRLRRAWAADAGLRDALALSRRDRAAGARLRPARPRRRGLPGRHQVAHRGADRSRAAEVRRLQRRRGRLRHLRRPHDAWRAIRSC